MIAACPAPDPRLPLVQSLSETVDCGVRVFAQSGYEALTRPPSPFPAIVTVLLTLYVALLGWGLLTGRGPRLADTPQLAVKIGFILALTASWPLFQALVFNTAFDGATAFVAVLTAPLRGGGQPDLWVGLQVAYDQIVRAAAALGASAGPDAQTLAGGPAAASEALWGASTALMASTLGVVLTAKVIVGVLTATGPVFIALFLIDATKGLFVGWLRALITAALIPLAASSALALLLALLEPRLALMAASAETGEINLSVAMGVAVLIFVFAAAQGCLIVAMAVAGLGLELKRPTPADVQPIPQGASTAAAEKPATEPSRAAAIVQSVRQLDVRDRRTSIETRSDGANRGGATGDGAHHPATPRLGQINRRISVAQPKGTA
ncbi:type IV secretion system protein [Caulobacter sp. NIBR2454]|uniref:type IV secretion system protein n=1 Tax=Caulobacter sp. NIBR2454 TaxID=3015996 RepID=UPI0022B6A53A|nr:type IV secretion system protein [Caulobacter sp. NIBR2454]